MRREDARRTLIAYDVPDDRRRTKLAKVLSAHGDRVQYSVFVIDCSPATLLRLKDKVRDTIHKDEDSVLFADLGRVRDLGETKYSYIGLAREITDNDMIIM